MQSLDIVHNNTIWLNMIKDFVMKALLAIKSLLTVALMNGIAEQKIKELMLGAQTLIFHAK
jgi:hypothetical protein